MGILKSINNWLSGKKTVKRKIKAYRRDGKTVKAHRRTMTVNDGYQRGFLPMEETQVEAANRGNAAYIDYERRQWQKDQDRLKAFLGFYEETGNEKMAKSVRARLGKTYR